MSEAQAPCRTLLEKASYPVYTAALLALPLLAYLSMRFVAVEGHHPFMWPLSVPIIALAPFTLLAWSWKSWTALRRASTGFGGLPMATRVAFLVSGAVSATVCVFLVWGLMRVVLATLSS